MRVEPTRAHPCATPLGQAFFCAPECLLCSLHQSRLLPRLWAVYLECLLPSFLWRSMPRSRFAPCFLCPVKQSSSVTSSMRKSTRETPFPLYMFFTCPLSPHLHCALTTPTPHAVLLRECSLRKSVRKDRPILVRRKAKRRSVHTHAHAHTLTLSLLLSFTHAGARTLTPHFGSQHAPGIQHEFCMSDQARRQKIVGVDPVEDVGKLSLRFRTPECNAIADPEECRRQAKVQEVRMHDDPLVGFHLVADVKVARYSMLITDFACGRYFLKLRHSPWCRAWRCCTSPAA